ncbi:BET1L isoform 2 [Pan troglodytes]|uniref:BET1L isoform 2 n=1 Tax=Pan troglodytes TaxID=9598 RepID=A0A2J8JW70_PANTR|nr:BET1L isoform 2 [Pan troglodytes]
MADWARAQSPGAVEEILDRENKRMADSLASKVTRLKSLALDIDRDAEDQNRYLDGMVFQDSQEGAHIRRETVSKSVCAEPWLHQRARDPAPTNFPLRCQKQRGASTSSGQHEGHVNLVFFIDDDYSPPSKRQRPTSHHSHQSQNPPMLGNGK